VRYRLKHQQLTPLPPEEQDQLLDGRCAAPDKRLHWQEMLHGLLEALDKLELEDPDAVAVFELRFFGGGGLVLGDTPGEFDVPDPVRDLLPFTEVAAILGIPRATAFAHWSRAVKRLRAELHAFAPPDS